MRLILPALAMTLLAGTAAADGHAKMSMATASATLQGVDGANHGTVTFTQTPTGVLVRADLTGVPAGTHGFHVHETGACDADGGFDSAGGHFVGASDAHGFHVAGGPHAGDLPNVHVPESGMLTVEFLNDRISLDEGADGYLKDADGSAVILHAGADDYHSQPAGDAGDRLACGVIE